MQRHAARAADRLVPPLRGQPGRVLGVAGLVQDGVEPGQEVRFVVAGGDADVARRAAGEGMVADIEPAAVEIEAERRHEPAAERLLPAGRERSLDP